MLHMDMCNMQLKSKSQIKETKKEAERKKNKARELGTGLGDFGFLQVEQAPHVCCSADYGPMPSYKNTTVLFAVSAKLLPIHPPNPNVTVQNELYVGSFLFLTSR
jgi:hypothetical protein